MLRFLSFKCLTIFVLIFFSSFLLVFLNKSLADPSPDSVPPPNAAKEQGYETRTFHGIFTPETIDLGKTKSPGYSWYFWDLFGRKANISSVQINDDGSATFLGDPDKSYGQLVSAVKTGNYPHFAGTAFGGGAYIEATLKFDREAVFKAKKGPVPAFWALQMEGDILWGKGHWPGMPHRYVHNIEVDIFELVRDLQKGKKNTYGASMHDWFGIHNETCSKSLCQEKMPHREGTRVVPEGTDFSEYHRYGFLWVPATETKKGLARFYFDGEQVGPDRRWNRYNNEPPPPIGKSWAFGIIDQRHLVLILSTGLKQPMTVKEVSVWQKDASSNLVGFTPKYD